MLTFAAMLVGMSVGGAPAPTPIRAGQALMLPWVSPIDGSTQHCGVYLPRAYDPKRARAFPLVFRGYGYGGRAGQHFPTALADRYGTIVATYDGRRIMQYDGVADVEFVYVLERLKRRYHVDATRVHFLGGSMGATGAFRLGFRHPDRLAAVGGTGGFLDYNLWYERWYGAHPRGPWRTAYAGPRWRRPLLEAGSVVHLAENGRHLACLFWAGGKDRVNRPENARHLAARLDQLRKAHPGDYAHVFEEVPTGGHGAGFNMGRLFAFFNDKRCDPLAGRLTYRANLLQRGRAFWVRMDRFQRRQTFGQIDTRMDAQANAVHVTTQNLRALALDLNGPLLIHNGLDPGRPVRLVCDGVTAYTGAAKPVSLYRRQAAGAWCAGRDASDTGLRKTARLEGPIAHAFMSRFLLVYGTAGTHAETRTHRAEAELFAGSWQSQMNTGTHRLAVVPERAPADMPDCNWIVFGHTDTSRLVRAMAPQMPVAVDRRHVRVGDRTYDARQHGLYVVYPNPLRAGRYVVVSCGTMTDHGHRPANLGYDLQTLPWAWPDYVVFRRDVPYDPKTMASVQNVLYPPALVVVAGFFDGRWRL